MFIVNHKSQTIASQTRFIVAYQPLPQFECGQAVIIHYSLLAYAIYTRQIYSATAIKSGCVIAWKVNDSRGGRSQRKRSLI